jgi:hypothetical protein
MRIVTPQHPNRKYWTVFNNAVVQSTNGTLFTVELAPTSGWLLFKTAANGSPLVSQNSQKPYAFNTLPLNNTDLQRFNITESPRGGFIIGTSTVNAAAGFNIVNGFGDEYLVSDTRTPK